MVHIEPDPKGLKVGIEVNNLKKDYGSGSCSCLWLKGKRKAGPAVDGLSFKAYENQITSFLGQNGAGLFGRLATRLLVQVTADAMGLMYMVKGMLSGDLLQSGGY